MLTALSTQTNQVRDNQSSEEQVELLLALNRAQAIIEFGLDGFILAANENFLKTTGYELKEILGKHHSMFCDPIYANSAEYRDFWNRLEEGKFDSREYRRLGKHNREIWINASYNPIFGNDGKPYKVVKFASDITEAKQKNAESDSKPAAIGKSQAIIEFELDGTIITANDNFLKTTAYELGEIRERHHSMFCDPSYVNSEAYQLFWKTLRSGQFSSGRYKRFGKGGKVVWIFASYNPVLDANGKVFKVVKFASDISSQVELEDEVTSIAESFETQSQSISEQAHKVAVNAQSLGATAEEMSATVEDLSVSIDSIAQNAKLANQIASQNHKDAQFGSQAIEKSIAAMELISRSAEEINDIAKVISEIAGQTNMLAFNAAIEAARAGEHGLGFSVVADEVRKLAERSSLATKEISKLIAESVKRIQNGSDVSKEASVAFKKIVDGVENTSKSISEISQSAIEQQASAKDVASAIQQVASSMEKSALASDAIAQATPQLTSGAESLRHALKKFER